MLTLEEAKKTNRCRICEKPIHVVSAPMGWREEFGELLFPPPKLTLNFGKEFAHTDCLSNLELQS